MAGEDQQDDGGYYPRGIPAPLVFSHFEGLDTQSSRPAIDDKRCSIIDGFFPEGPSNLRTLPGVGPALYTAPGGLTVILFKFGNIASTPYCFVFLSDGSIVAVNTNTSSANTIASAGAILNPSINNVGVSQWGNQYIVIVSNQTNGFFLWDGTNLLKSGTLGPDVTIQNNGLGYTSAPTVTTFGGSGSGASFSVTLQNGFVQAVSVLNPGSGWTGTDAPVLAFSGGGNSARTAKISLIVNPGGSITGSSIVDAGAGYTSVASLQIQGGGGVGGVLTANVSGGSITSVGITTPGQAYSSVSPPVLYVVDANNPVAQATIDVMPSGISGTSAEVYTSRLWIANGRRIQYSAPGSVVNFSSAVGGGAFNSTDSFLRNSFTALKQVNGYLWLVADSSMNYISGVATSSTSVTTSTTFTNANSDPEVGTQWPATVDTFARGVIFANSFGIHTGTGGALVKISDPLDGLWTSPTNFSGASPSSAKAIIFGKKVYMVLLPVTDQVSGQLVNKLLMFNGKVWFTSQQDMSLTYISGQEIGSVLTAYGTDGKSIKPIFNTPSVGFVKTVQSKLWDRGAYWHLKTVNRLWGLVNYNSLLSPSFNVSVDSESGQSNSILLPGANGLAWANSHGALTWTNSHGALTWFGAGLGVVVLPPTAVGQQGVLVGLTLTTRAADMVLISLAIDAPPQDYRG